MLNVQGSQSYLLLVILPSQRYFYDELAVADLMWNIPYKQHKVEVLGTDF